MGRHNVHGGESEHFHRVVHGLMAVARNEDFVLVVADRADCGKDSSRASVDQKSCVFRSENLGGKLLGFENNSVCVVEIVKAFDFGYIDFLRAVEIGKIRTLVSRHMKRHDFVLVVLEKQVGKACFVVFFNAGIAKSFAQSCKNTLLFVFHNSIISLYIQKCYGKSFQPMI